MASERAFIRVAGHAVDVIVAVTGERDADAVDEAYRIKYGVAGSQSMITAEASASTILPHARVRKPHTTIRETQSVAVSERS